MRAEGTDPNWYLIQCKPREDDRALENLERQEFECYRPIYERERVRQRRRILTRAPLFPGYLFIRLDRLNDNWLPICSTRGVVRIVRFAGEPLPVADEIIEEIRRRIDGHPIREPYLNAGDRVMITDGSFSGIQGIFMTSDGDERVILLLNILHTEQRLSFPIESVRRVPVQ
jgi:transcriptional antiterminator RfaH